MYLGFPHHLKPRHALAMHPYNPPSPTSTQQSNSLYSGSISIKMSDHEPSTSANNNNGNAPSGAGGGSAGGAGAAAAQEHLNIKVTDNNNEVFFKIKRTTQLKKLMDAFCDRQGKMPSTVRFLFEGTRVQGGDTPDTVSFFSLISFILVYFPVCGEVMMGWGFWSIG